MKEKHSSVPGQVTGRLPRDLFRVTVEGGHQVTAHISVEKRIHITRLLDGDRVRLGISPTDRSRGRIIERVKAGGRHEGSSLSQENLY